MHTVFRRHVVAMTVAFLVVAPLTQAQEGAYSIEHQPTQPGMAKTQLHEAADEPGKVSRTVSVTTSEGVFDVHEPDVAAEPGLPMFSEKGSISLWQVDDDIAIAEGVAMGNNKAWGAWRLLDGRVSAYPISGDGVPDLEYSAFDIDNRHAGVASARGSDRILYVEGSIDEDEYWAHSFTSQSAGVPDWSFEFPGMTDMTINFRHVSVSHDGSTAAAIARNTLEETYSIYVFDANTGNVLLEWVNDSIINAVELTDDGSIALVTQQNLATVVDTETGDTLFQTSGSGGGALHYRVSGDGSVLVVGGFDLHVYKLNDGEYEQIIDFTLQSSWFGLASVVSRDGSTVGTLTRTTDTSWLNIEAVMLDVESGEVLGSLPLSGTGSFQGSPRTASSNDDGSVMAFGSWGTEDQDWPEVMVFNRDMELIGAIEFPGSALSVDVSSDGQYVVGGAKAVHANFKGNGGRIELIEIVPDDNPIPVLSELHPDAVEVGSPEITLTVDGKGFRAESVVRFDGSDRPTTFIDTETLEVQIPASDLTVAGKFPVTVFSPAPGGGSSKPLAFEVVPEAQDEVFHDRFEGVP